MNRAFCGHVLLAVLVVLGGCSDSNGGGGGSGGSAGTGGTGGTRPCTSSGTVAFQHTAFDAAPDCIVPGVCIKRGRVKGIYNSASELAANSAVSPEGTQWALSTCATATTPGDFKTITALFSGGTGGGSVGDGIGENIVDADLCLWLTNEDLFYDVVFSEWGTVALSSFAYERTAVAADECGAAGATCGATCGCPPGWVNEGGSGICVLPDPCESNPCGAGATCRKTGATSHRCECDTVEFTKPPGQTSVDDCVSAGVCLARGDNRALYNSLQENEAAADSVCDVDIALRPVFPTLTEWVRAPCASTAPGDFVIFLDQAFACKGVPRRIVGFHSCLHTTDDDELWDIQFTDWCPSDTGGCFSYVRWHAVGDGVACP